MSRRDFRQWTRKQYSGDVQPFPRWLRWTIAAGVLLIVLAKLAGLI